MFRQVYLTVQIYNKYMYSNTKRILNGRHTMDEHIENRQKFYWSCRLEQSRTEWKVSSESFENMYRDTHHTLSG